MYFADDVQVVEGRVSLREEGDFGGGTLTRLDIALPGVHRHHLQITLSSVIYMYVYISPDTHVHIM